MDAVLETMVEMDLPRDTEERDMDEELMRALHDHVCPRCHYDTDEDGYCSVCGATCGRC